MATNMVYMQVSGTMFDGMVAAGSQTVGLNILCGVSGTGVFPLMVNELGQMIQISGA